MSGGVSLPYLISTLACAAIVLWRRNAYLLANPPVERPQFPVRSHARKGRRVGVIRPLIGRYRGNGIPVLRRPRALPPQTFPKNRPVDQPWFTMRDRQKPFQGWGVNTQPDDETAP